VEQNPAIYLCVPFPALSLGKVKNSLKFQFLETNGLTVAVCI